MARFLQIGSWVILVILFLAGLANISVGWTNVISIWLLAFIVFSLMLGLGKTVELLSDIQLRLNEKDKG